MNVQKREADLSADASNKETLPVVQHGLLQETLLGLALQQEEEEEQQCERGLVSFFFLHVSGCLCVFGWVTYQHEVDVEVEYLVAHVHAEVVAEMVSQVGESSG